MLKEIVAGSVLYWSTSVDLILISVVMIAAHPFPGEKIRIILGEMFGSTFLIVVSLFLALVLRLVPQEWLLGLLGIIPLGFGIKCLIGESEDLSGVNKTNDVQHSKTIMWTMMLLAVTSCAPDNIGLFTPYFATLDQVYLTVVIIVLVINVLLMGVLTNIVSRIAVIQRFLFKYASILAAITYIGLGVMIIFEENTIPNLWNFIFG